jgi:hypothetical protein
MYFNSYTVFVTSDDAYTKYFTSTYSIEQFKGTSPNISS